MIDDDTWTFRGGGIGGGSGGCAWRWLVARAMVARRMVQQVASSTAAAVEPYSSSQLAEAANAAAAWTYAS